MAEEMSISEAVSALERACCNLRSVDNFLTTPDFSRIRLAQRALQAVLANDNVRLIRGNDGLLDLFYLDARGEPIRRNSADNPAQASQGRTSRNGSRGAGSSARRRGASPATRRETVPRVAPEERWPSPDAAPSASRPPRRYPEADLLPPYPSSVHPDRVPYQHDEAVVQAAVARHRSRSRSRDRDRSPRHHPEFSGEYPVYGRSPVPVRSYPVVPQQFTSARDSTSRQPTPAAGFDRPRSPSPRRRAMSAGEGGHAVSTWEPFLRDNIDPAQFGEPFGSKAVLSRTVSPARRLVGWNWQPVIPGQVLSTYYVDAQSGELVMPETLESLGVAGAVQSAQPKFKRIRQYYPSDSVAPIQA